MPSKTFNPKKGCREPKKVGNHWSTTASDWLSSFPMKHEAFPSAAFITKWNLKRFPVKVENCQNFKNSPEQTFFFLTQNKIYQINNFFSWEKLIYFSHRRKGQSYEWAFVKWLLVLDLFLLFQISGSQPGLNQHPLGHWKALGVPPNIWAWHLFVG